MSRWNPITERDDPAGHIRTDVIPFVLTEGERSKCAVYSMALERNRRKQNELELRQALNRAANQPQPPEAA